MKSILSALAFVAPLTVGACDLTSIMPKVSSFMWILGGADYEAEVAKMCGEAGDKGKGIKDALASIVTECGGSESRLKPIFDLLSDTLCQKEEEQYCLPAVLTMAPVMDIVTASMANPPTLDKLDYYKNLQDVTKLNVICKSTLCTRSIAHQAAKTMRQMGLAENPFIMNLIKAAGSACVASGDTECSATDFMQTDGTIDAAKACKDNKIDICFRKVASTRGIDVPKDLCNPKPVTDADKEEVGSAILNIANFAIDYFKANEEKVLDYIKKDLGFNLPGILPGDIDITVAAGANDGIQVDISFKGQDLISADLDLQSILDVFKQLLADHPDTITFPNLDTIMDLGSPEKLVSGSITLGESTISTLPPSAAAPTSAEDQNSGVASLSYPLLTSVGLVLLAPVLAN